MVTRAGEVQDGVGDGGRSGGNGQRAHSAFERCDSALQDVLCGVGEAAVDVAGVGQAKACGSVLAVMEYVRGRLVDGNGAGVGGGVGVFLSYMKLEGLEVEFCHIDLLLTNWLQS